MWRPFLMKKRMEIFWTDFRGFHRRLAFYGMLNSLSQTLLKITTPGVPDFYQGSELWDLRLVDPDNRGTIDFGRRIELLQTIQQDTPQGDAGLVADLYKNWTDGRIKLYLIWKALQLRQKFGGLFTDGDFVPAEVSGEHAENVTAFFRVGKDGAALIIAPKWLAASGMENGESARKRFLVEDRDQLTGAHGRKLAECVYRRSCSEAIQRATRLAGFVLHAWQLPGRFAFPELAGQTPPTLVIAAANFRRFVFGGFRLAQAALQRFHHVNHGSGAGLGFLHDGLAFLFGSDQGFEVVLESVVDIWKRRSLRREYPPTAPLI